MIDIVQFLLQLGAAFRHALLFARALGSSNVEQFEGDVEVHRILSSSSLRIGNEFQIARTPIPVESRWRIGIEDLSFEFAQNRGNIQADETSEIRQGDVDFVEQISDNIAMSLGRHFVLRDPSAYPLSFSDAETNKIFSLKSTTDLYFLTLWTSVSRVYRAGKPASSGGS